MIQGRMLDNGKPQTGSAACLGPTLVHAIEPLKYLALFFRRDTDSRVGNFNKRMFIVITCYDFYRTVFTIVTDCIVTKIVDKFVNLITVSVYDGSFCINSDCNSVLFGI